jgi:hypothetical protein
VRSSRTTSPWPSTTNGWVTSNSTSIPARPGRLHELQAGRAVRNALDLITNQLIVSARLYDPVLTWKEIGAALGITGLAAGQHARTHDLPVDPVTPDDYLHLVAEARAARGLPPLPQATRPPPDLNKYDELLQHQWPGQPNPDKTSST